MEDELDYTTVTFKTHGVSTAEKDKDLEVIYAEVTTDKQALEPHPVRQEHEAKAAPPHTALGLLATGLAVTCVILTSAIIAVSIYLNAVISEQRRENVNLTAQTLQLWAENTELRRQTGQLSRERDRLNWTMGVILEHQYFPVHEYCPDKVCKQCLDGWLPFQSKCYLFSESYYSSGWRSWRGSRHDCTQKDADLVVIETEEEQEFINNHTETYNDERHGYWIGLTERQTDQWVWVDGGHLSAEFWVKEQIGYRGPCGLSLPSAPSSANWNKVSCDMRNLWICEKKALIKPE